MNWLYYLAEANLYLCVFYVAYCIFLVKETHYQLNRGYLLLSCVASFVLPVLQIGTLKPHIIAQIAAPVSYQVTSALQPVLTANLVNAPVTVTAPALTIDDYLWLAYLAGAIILLLLLVLKLFSVIKLTRNDKAAIGNYKMVYLKDTDVAFSFFNYLFIGTRAAGANTIITHELVHIRQRHSADIMFLELLKVVCWFNPCIYLLQNSLKTVHEYIADEQTAATETDSLTYSSFLVNNAYGAGGSSITHSFFNYNLLKKRIIMLNQQRSGKLARLKYLVALPVCAALLCASTLVFSKTYGWVDLDPINRVNTSSGTIDTKSLIADTLITKKGYKYTESFHKEDGFTACNVTFYETDGSKSLYKSFPASGSMIKMLKNTYGYEFPKGSLPPEPPKPKIDQVRFPAKSKRGYDVIKFPPTVIGKNGEKSTLEPPPPPKPKVDKLRFPPGATGELQTTNKGYQYEETGYLINEKETNFRVIIHLKNGEERAYFRNSATKAQITMLNDKYGYKFPTMKIDNMYPPPPPMAPVAAPVNKPTSGALNGRNSNGGNVSRVGFKNVIVTPQNSALNRADAMRLIVVNDKPVVLSEKQKDQLNTGSNLSVSASDSLVSYGPNNPYALSKWGQDASNGVLLLYGKTNISTTK